MLDKFKVIRDTAPNYCDSELQEKMDYWLEEISKSGKIIKIKNIKTWVNHYTNFVLIHYQIKDYK